MSFEPSNLLPDSEAPSHDKLVKTIIQAFFRDLLEMLHPELAQVLAWSSVEFIAGSAFADFRKHGQVEPDVVVKVGSDEGDEQFVIVHIESEAKFTTAMERRMRRYYLQLELKYDMPVVAAVIYLKGGPPGVTLHEVVRKVGPWKCGSSFYLSFGLSGSLAEDWVNRPQLLAAALAALMSSRLWDRVEKKLQCLRRIAEEKDNDRRFLLSKMVDTYLQLKGTELDRFEAALQSEAEEVRKMAITWSETLAEHEAIGEARGEAQGRAAATRQAILLYLNRTIGPMPSALQEQIEAITDLDRLHQLLEAAFGARSMADFEAAVAGQPAPSSLPH